MRLSSPCGVCRWSLLFFFSVFDDFILDQVMTLLLRNLFPEGPGRAALPIGWLRKICKGELGGLLSRQTAMFLLRGQLARELGLTILLLRWLKKKRMGEHLGLPRVIPEENRERVSPVTLSLHSSLLKAPNRGLLREAAPRLEVNGAAPMPPTALRGRNLV